MNIIKRDKSFELYDSHKIKNAIMKAFQSLSHTIDSENLEKIICEIDQIIIKKSSVTVEDIQDLVETKLMEHSYYPEAKAYILYRQKRAENRIVLEMFYQWIPNQDWILCLSKIEKEYGYSVQNLYQKFKSFYKESCTQEERKHLLIKACVEMTSKEEPQWEYIAAKFLGLLLNCEINERNKDLGIHSFYEKIEYLTREGLYGEYILEQYTKEEIDTLANYLKYERDHLLNYSGLDLLISRYLICSKDHKILENVQEMFMGMAMHLALLEKEKVHWAKEIYDILSTLQVTMATPTMSNARKPFHQMSSCFIDAVPDSLQGIYQSLDNFAQVSKHGGGMGLYFGKVRANGSDIRGFKGAAGGVIRWIKLVNDTAIAVDQLGVRQGAVAVYLDAWHKDLPEFLQLKTNNGDDRMKAHDIFPAICYPDLFWKMAEEHIDGMWYMMCPHEIYQVKGYHLEDYFGEEWEIKYWDCVQDARIDKRGMPIKSIIRLILKSAIETGTPFTFNRDIVNRANPNSHKGIIYCSNLCTEIAQNMQSMENISTQEMCINDETVVVETIRPGDFVVCNLASLTLGKIDVENDGELQHVIEVVVRALDNVIDLNYYPIPYAHITNQKYRSIGLGTSGYHHMLTKLGIPFESEEHLQFVDSLYEKISFYTIQASMHLAQEKGKYSLFEGSDWDTGHFFQKRKYKSKKWDELAQQVHKNGVRNAYMLAIAPTSSTSIIAGTTACCDPIMNKFYLEEKKGSMIARVAPDLNAKSYWLYKNAHLIDQSWLIRAAGIRQRHIDQSQSVNLYITNEYTFRGVLNLYIQAYKEGIKTIYYVRSKSLEIEECESCSA